MKIIISEEYSKFAKSKYPKSETEPTNPWAVCNKSTGGKKKSPAKFERCVQHVKQQNRKENKSKDMKPAQPGAVYSPAVEEKDDESGFHSKQKGQIHRNRPPSDKLPKTKTWQDVLDQIKQKDCH